MKCVSSCFSCICGSKSPTRVSPGDPVEIIQANSNSSKHVIQVHHENGGKLNPNFTGDESDSETAEGQQPNGICVSAMSSPVKALYIEVGKDRLLRVIHIKSSSEESETLSPKGSKVSSTKGSSLKSNSPEAQESEEGTSPKESSTGEDGDESEHPEGGGGEDDEEEYWFTKWARKPRFRSIFAKNSENRPRISESNNNNPEENGKVTAELEVARAAAAAKRRAWAYNNNGNRESTINQQPTVTPSDEEEFNSIAIVNTSKQQWTKGSNEIISQQEEESPKSNSSSGSTVQVQVAVETHKSDTSSVSNGISNPAFEDEEEDEEEGKQEKTDKTEDDSTNVAKESESGGSPSTQSMASAKSRLSTSTSAEEEDAITSEPQEENKKSPSSLTATPNSVKSYMVAPPDGSNPAINAPPQKKPLIFFVHSISGSSDVWHKQLEFFHELGYEVVAPDMLGHGLSSTPLNPKYYTFESLVQDLILIFDHFTKDDIKVVLVGHGYGACLAAMLTRVRLKNVALLITIAGGGPTPLVRRTCCQDSWFSWKCKLFHSNRIRGRFDNPELKHVLPSCIHENILSGQVWGDGDSSFYRRVTVPTLLVYGMRDKVVTLVEECEMERTIPKSFLELIDTAGHMVMLDAPEKLNKMLCKFIQSWS